jgi:hypothetical protein
MLSGTLSGGTNLSDGSMSVLHEALFLAAVWQVHNSAIGKCYSGGQVVGVKDDGMG